MKENIQENIIVLDSIRQYITPPSEDEKRQLEENIIVEGCRDALIVAPIISSFGMKHHEGKYLLVDGHNRYDICTKHNIEFRVVVKDFENLSQVKSWMIDNQLGKRNLTPEQVAYYRGLTYNTYKGDKNDNLVKGKIYPSVNTAKELSSKFSVSEKTIKNDARYAKNLELLKPETKNAILTGKLEVNRNVIEKADTNTINKIEDLYAKSTKYGLRNVHR